jgi:hypothetical protein
LCFEVFKRTELLRTVCGWREVTKRSKEVKVAQSNLQNKTSKRKLFLFIICFFSEHWNDDIQQHVRVEDFSRKNFVKNWRNIVKKKKFRGEKMKQLIELGNMLFTEKLKCKVPLSSKLRFMSTMFLL